jgi:hypothetical protein
LEPETETFALMVIVAQKMKSIKVNVAGKGNCAAAYF